jgi:hypothetical protein
MIDAKIAKMCTDIIKFHEVEETKLLIKSNYSIGWSLLKEQIENSRGYSIDVKQAEVLASFSDNKYWDSDRIYLALMSLGFKVKFSYSSNPDNERWIIVWKHVGE